MVGSVFTDHTRSAVWYDLQMKYLRRTTKDYTHVVFLNGDNDIYTSSKVIRRSAVLTGSAAHAEGLNALIDYFHTTSHDRLLLIDSDCFPIRDDWFGRLSRYPIAAAVRYENLDTFAHPCVFFMGRSNVRFSVSDGVNLLGRKFQDTMSNVTEFFPLLRSNKVNRHPILGGVYWNSFYHHGAGSRGLGFRLFDSGYYDNIDHKSIEEALFQELTHDPDKFLDAIGDIKMVRAIY